MRRPLKATAGAMLLSALALAGCASSSAPKAVTIPFKSPALLDTSLPALYTCDGKNISPPLEWGAVPSATRELAVFMLGLTPNTAKSGFKTSVEWAIAGVNPALHRLAAGELPPGAHIGLTNKGKRQPYSVCPPKGTTKRYQFALYAIPALVTIPARFAAAKVLEVIANPESAETANAGGAFVASYTRPSHARKPRRRPAERVAVGPARSRLSSAALLVAIALAGCGSAGTKGAPIQTTTEFVHVTLSSKAIRGTRLPAAYTCDAKDISPPLAWSALPANIEQLALFAIRVSQKRTGQSANTIEWAMAGVNPALRNVRAGEIPRGAFVLKADDGKKRYSICPAPGHTERYQFVLYALPHHIRASRTMSAAELVRNLTDPPSPQYLTPASGALTVTYTRR